MSLDQIRSHFKRVYIHRDSLASKVAQNCIKLFEPNKIVICDQEPSRASQDSSLSAEEFSESKKILYVTPFRGHFFKRCPGATQKRKLTCCNYFVLNLGQQCNMNCSYCYLQSYINSPYMMIYSNIDEALKELEQTAIEFPNHPFRVGTGEVIDSLSLDELTLYSRDLIAFFRKYPNWTLEFKTKSDQVDQFLDMEHAKNVVVSWSINPQFVIEREEHGTASLTARLEAAEKCLTKGYRLSFHLDPLIWHPEWRENYSLLIDEITQRFKPKDIPYLSVGALRLKPEQKQMMRERFGMKSLVTQAELFHSEGGKLRYDLQIRNTMFDHVIKGFKDKDPQWRIFMCMETPESWIQHYDKSPTQVEDLGNLFRPLPKPILTKVEN